MANSVDSVFSPVPGFYPQKGVIELHKIAFDGISIWKKGFLTKDIANGDTLFNTTNEIARTGDGNLFITGYLYKSQQTEPDQFIIRLDSNGQGQQWRLIKGIRFPKMEVTDDAIYLLDKGDLEYIPHIDLVSPNSALLIKLDHNLNFIWAKKYHAENFKYYTATIRKTPSGNLLMAHTTLGGYPVVLTELDPNGNIIIQKGYPNYSPRIIIMSDGSYLMASQGSGVDSVGQFTNNLAVIAKTDSLGNIEGCENYPTCLEVSDTTIEFGTFHIEPHPILDLEDILLEVEPASFTFTPFCDYPPPPIPTFSFPDSLCLGASATSLSDRNRLAQTREWQLTGPPGIDSLLRDSFEFSYTFNQPGEYVLRQSVWVLGCRSDYERSITVLPPITVAIAADSLLCPDEPQEISAMANRNASYTWNNPTGASNQTGATLPVTASGTYTVTATDGVCEATDSVTVTVVAGILGNSPAFTLPPDTTVCERDMPILLIPQSHFTDVFYFENGAVQAASYPLTSAGVFKVGMEAFGCNFEKLFRLTVDCHADVYLPNSFSPNGDGINDVFQPFGTDFEVLELSIYGRWGGLLHKGVDWDGGKAPKGQAGQGIYVYKLVYRDLLNLETVTLNGEVVLVR